MPEASYLGTHTHTHTHTFSLSLVNMLLGMLSADRK